MEDTITLRPMTRALCHALYARWENDPAIYRDEKQMKPFQYDPAWVDGYYHEKQDDPQRIFLAVMRGGEIIGTTWRLLFSRTGAKLKTGSELSYCRTKTSAGRASPWK